MSTLSPLRRAGSRAVAWPPLWERQRRSPALAITNSAWRPAPRAGMIVWVRDDPLLTTVAEALGLLLDYVDARPARATADDDVRALEQVAAVLHGLSAEDVTRLVPLIGDERSKHLGLFDP